MSARKLRILHTAPARSDLRDILNYTEREWGKAQRSIYRQLIRNTINTLAHSPSLGRSRDELSEGLRSYPISSHVLYYWEIEGVLVVAHILHGRRDAAQETWGEPPPSD